MKRIFLFIVTNLAVLALLSVAVIIIEQAFGVRLASGGLGGLLLFAGIFAMSGALISLGLSQWSARRLMGVRVVAAPQTDIERWLVATVRRLADYQRIGMPEVGIFDADQMNAFATGARRDAALVAVSSGLLNGMSRAQAEAVLGHEITHVANGDMVTLTLPQGVLNTFVIFFARIVGSVVDRVLFKIDRDASGRGFFPHHPDRANRARNIGKLNCQLVFAAAGIRADRGGADLAGAGSMIAALDLLKRREVGEPLPHGLQAFGINPTGSGGSCSCS